MDILNERTARTSDLSWTRGAERYRFKVGPKRHSPRSCLGAQVGALGWLFPTNENPELSPVIKNSRQLH